MEKKEAKVQDDKLTITLTQNCAVCKGNLESPIFCNECGTPHCAACWFLTGKCSLYGCDNSNSNRPSSSEQRQALEDAGTQRIFDTLTQLRKQLTHLEVRLYHAESQNIKLNAYFILLSVLGVFLAAVIGWLVIP